MNARTLNRFESPKHSGVRGLLRHSSLLILISLFASAVFLFLFGISQSWSGVAGTLQSAGLAERATGVSVASFFNSGFSLLVACFAWIIWAAELRSQPKGLSNFGWLGTAAAFTALAILVTPALQALLPLGLFKDLGSLGLNGETLAYPVIAQIAFGVLLFLWSQKPKGLDISLVTAGFLLQLIVGLIHLVRVTPNALEQMASASVTAEEMRQIIGAAEIVLLLIAISLILTAFASYIERKEYLPQRIHAIS